MGLWVEKERPTLGLALKLIIAKAESKNNKKDFLWKSALKKLLVLTVSFTRSRKSLLKREHKRKTLQKKKHLRKSNKKKKRKPKSLKTKKIRTLKMLSLKLYMERITINNSS